MNRILDPRTKLCLLILAAVYISLQMNVQIEIFLILIYVLPFFLAGLMGYGLLFLLIYTFQLSAFLFIMPLIESAFLIFILSFLTSGFRILLPSIIIGTYGMKTTTVSEWIAAFKKIRLPNWLIIPLAVMARFFPTIREDYRSIRNAMAFRGIGTSFWDLIKHPIKTLEFILVPLLMNATQVSEDLTVSSLTKGLSLPGRHTSIVRLKMMPYDFVYLVLAILPLVYHIIQGGIL